MQFRRCQSIFFCTICLLEVGLLCPISGCGQAGRETLPPISSPVFTEADSAEAIVTKVIAASGGEKTFSLWKCGYVKYEMKMSGAPGPSLIEDTFQLPGHFKRVGTIFLKTEEQRVEFVINNGQGWTKSEAGAVRPIQNDFTNHPQHILANYSNLKVLTDAKIHVVKLGKLRVGGHDTLGIRVTSELLDEVDFYFSLNDGLLRKSIKMAQLPGDEKPALVEAVLDKYIEVQGAKIPTKIVGAKHDEEFMEIRILDIRFFDHLPDVPFAKP
jgi:hypothetical protein